MTTHAKVTSEQLIEMLEETNFEPRSYSGRGMFGKECIAVSGDDASVWEIARALPMDVHIPEPSTDAMGLGIVVYWPSLPWPEGRG